VQERPVERRVERRILASLRAIIAPPRRTRRAAFSFLRVSLEAGFESLPPAPLRPDCGREDVRRRREAREASAIKPFYFNKLHLKKFWHAGCGHPPETCGDDGCRPSGRFDKET
jgi:hypothetical protein